METGSACEFLLGSDFISKTGLVLDIAKQEFYFHFSSQKFRLAPSVRSNFFLQCMARVTDTNQHAPVLDQLTHTQRARLERVLGRFPDVLRRRLGLTHLIEYEIRLTDGTPVRSSPYRLAPPKMEFLRQHIQTLLEDGVIEMSLSHYSSPMFLVPKPDNGYRAVVDYRALNEKIEVESVPLPDVHSAF